MKNLAKKIVNGAAFGASVLALPLLALAQINLPTQAPSVDISTPQAFGTVIDKVVNYAFGVLLGVAIIYILYAAYLYLTGDEKNIEKAKTQIIYSAVAIIVALLARSLPFLVANVISGGQVR